MVRTLNLRPWAGRWVALDRMTDEVVRHAATIEELTNILDAEGIEGTTIMRAPAPDEPIFFGLG